jgi:diaminohydroxyphosphoribosylaminopyrimidine deaminase/5-amino-6-(5-phosphoribosylamino)uracil reductase
VDKVVGYTAPVLLGSGQWPVLRGTGQRSMADAVRLDVVETVRLGDDLRITAYPTAARPTAARPTATTDQER